MPIASYVGLMGTDVHSCSRTWEVMSPWIGGEGVNCRTGRAGALEGVGGRGYGALVSWCGRETKTSVVILRSIVGLI